MAEATATQRRSYPLPAYSFLVTVDAATASFSEVSGIAIEYQTVEYRHGFAWEGPVLTRYRPAAYTQATLKKGTTAGNNFLGLWLARGRARAIAISLCDEQGRPLVSWRIASALPVKLTAPSFDASTNSVSIDTLDLMVSGISVEHHRPA